MSKYKYVRVPDDISIFAKQNVFLIVIFQSLHSQYWMLGRWTSEVARPRLFGLPAKCNCKDSIPKPNFLRIPCQDFRNAPSAVTDGESRRTSLSSAPSSESAILHRRTNSRCVCVWYGCSLSLILWAACERPQKAAEEHLKKYIRIHKTILGRKYWIWRRSRWPNALPAFSSRSIPL